MQLDHKTCIEYLKKVSVLFPELKKVKIRVYNGRGPYPGTGPWVAEKKNTITVYRGVYEQKSPEDLMSDLTHELSHIVWYKEKLRQKFPLSDQFLPYHDIEKQKRPINFKDVVFHLLYQLDETVVERIAEERCKNRGAFQYTRNAYFSYRDSFFMHLTGIKSNLDMDRKGTFRSFKFYSNVTEPLLSAYRKTREFAYAYLGKPIGKIYFVPKMPTLKTRKEKDLQKGP